MKDYSGGQIENIWAGHVENTVERVYTRFWWGNRRKREHLEDPGLDERIILR
jgi:hypothetical protein